MHESPHALPTEQTLQQPDVLAHPVSELAPEIERSANAMTSAVVVRNFTLAEQANESDEDESTTEDRGGSTGRIAPGRLNEVEAVAKLSCLLVLEQPDGGRHEARTDAESNDT